MGAHPTVMATTTATASSINVPSSSSVGGSKMKAMKAILYPVRSKFTQESVAKAWQNHTMAAWRDLDWLREWPWQSSSSSSSSWQTLQACLHHGRTHYWWTWPLLLCFIPPVHWALTQQPALTPTFWRMVNMEYIRQSRDALCVIAVFLGSNASYLLSAVWLLIRLPPSSRAARRTRKKPVPVQHSEGTYSGHLAQLSRKRPTCKKRRGVICRYSALGWGVLTAGIVSTVFHTVQALGDTVTAEALCYLDHGVAGTAVFYFWHTCGTPRGWTLILGGVGLVALSLPLRPGYAWLHSLWHVLSAAAAVAWSMQGKAARRQILLQRVQQQPDRLSRNGVHSTEILIKEPSLLSRTVDNFSTGNQRGKRRFKEIARD